MPISKKQFELGIDPTTSGWMEAIYDYLESHQDLAYSASELASAMGAYNPSAGPLLRFKGGFLQALDALTAVGIVEKREIADTSYFMFARKADKKTWEVEPPRGW